MGAPLHTSVKHLLSKPFADIRNDETTDVTKAKTRHQASVAKT